MTRSEAYTILNLPVNSSKEQIQEQFSKLIQKFKPDESPEQFMRIHQAYKLLTDNLNQESTNPFSASADYLKDPWDDLFQSMDDLHDKEEARRQEEERIRKQQEEEEKKATREKIKSAIRESILAFQEILSQPQSHANIKALKTWISKAKEQHIYLEKDFTDQVQATILEKSFCRQYCSVLKKAYLYSTKAPITPAQNQLRHNMWIFLDNKYPFLPDILPAPVSFKEAAEFFVGITGICLLVGFSMEEAILQCLFLGGFLLAERFLRKHLRFRRVTILHITSVICTILLYYPTQHYRNIDPQHADLIILSWTSWFIYAMISGFIFWGHILQLRPRKIK